MPKPLAVVVALLLAAPAFAQPGGPATRPSPLIHGLWVWKAQFVQDSGQRDQMLAFCRQRDFNRLLVQIFWDKSDPLHPAIRYRDEFTALLHEAAGQHVTVEALDGAPEMGLKDHHARSLATLDAVLAFNDTLAPGDRLAGIHWDIEPYTHGLKDAWKDPGQRPGIMREYLDLLAAARERIRSHTPVYPFTLAVDIPMWYDNKTAPGDSCVLAYGGQTKNFHQHIQDLTDYVGIMSYRQSAVGPNSASDQVRAELAYAGEIHKFVCPAFETIQLKDTPQITFFGLPAEKFLREQRLLQSALSADPAYGGMFVHNYPAVRNLLEAPAP